MLSCAGWSHANTTSNALASSLLISPALVEREVQWQPHKASHSGLTCWPGVQQLPVRSKQYAMALIRQFVRAVSALQCSAGAQ
jgi:hypothetical protein